MKTQETRQDPNPRKIEHRNTLRAAPAAPASQTRKLPLILALAVMLLAARSAQAVIMINANEVGGNVVFTLSGSLNTGSIDSITVMDDNSSYHQDHILPYNHSGVPPGDYSFIFFGSPLPLGANTGFLANLTGPSGYSAGGPFVEFSHPSTNPGSLFGFYKLINPDLGSVFFPSSYSNLAPLSASMSFTGTFSSLNLGVGTYQWDWFNSSTNVHDSLIMQIGDSVPEPSAAMLLVIGLAALGWLCRKIVA